MRFDEETAATISFALASVVVLARFPHLSTAVQAKLTSLISFAVQDGILAYCEHASGAWERSRLALPSDN